jgi:hypothetical protein
MFDGCFNHDFDVFYRDIGRDPASAHKNEAAGPSCAKRVKGIIHDLLLGPHDIH